MKTLEIMQEIKTLKNLKKNATIKIEKEKQKIKEYENRINEIQKKCEHDYEYKTVFYMEERTCKICGDCELY